MHVRNLLELLDQSDQSLRVVGFDYREVHNLELAIIQTLDGKSEVVYRLVTNGKAFSAPADQEEERALQRLKDLGYD